MRLTISEKCLRCAVAGLVLASVYAWPSVGMENTSAPNLAPDPTVGWVPYGSDFIQPPSGPGPVAFDPAHPFYPDQAEYRRAQPNRKDPEQPTFRVANLDNPILQPWAREELRKRNELVLSGKAAYTRDVSCWPLGVPGFLLSPVQPTYFIQTPNEVVQISQEDELSRHIHMNVPHSEHVKPSWYGESVGHYDGDTLVVDTIGLNDKTYVDNYRTPHSAKLHVMERYHLIDGGKTLEVKIHVEDPGAFTTPWDAIQRYIRVELGPLQERRCAENNPNYFGYLEPKPQADKPDF